MFIGHQKQWQFLKKAAELEKVAHGLLFYGPSSIGKKTVALEFVKLLNCLESDFKKRPCQKCSSCLLIQKKQYPDLILIEPCLKEQESSSAKQSIQISQIRELNWKLSLRPHSAIFKAAVIDEAHLMNPQAQNCFLKTLEEPKGKTLLILVTQHPEMLLPTIISRVQKVRFSPVKKSVIKNSLFRESISKEKVEEITSFSFGKPGLALNFLSDFQKLENQKKNISDIVRINKFPLVSRFQYAKDLSQNSENLKEVLESWLVYFRNVLLEKSKANYDLLFSSLAPNNYPLLKIKEIIKALLRTKFLISSTNVNLRLALELLLIEF